MLINSTVVPLRQPDTIDDPLTVILRSGARRLLAQGIEAEADAFLAEMKGYACRTGASAPCFAGQEMSGSSAVASGWTLPDARPKEHGAANAGGAGQIGGGPDRSRRL